LITTHLIVVRSGLPLPAAGAGELVVSDGEVRKWLRDGRLLARIGRYRVSRLVTERLATSGRPMIMWALRLTARQCFIVDCEGQERRVTLALLTRWSWSLMRDIVARGNLLRRVENEIGSIAETPAPAPVWNRSAPVLYLRTDLSFGVRAGGSVGHIAGVLNALTRSSGPPILVTTAPVPTLRPDTEQHLIETPEAFWNFRELPALALNDVVVNEALRAANARDVSLVYQRYSVHNYAGLRLARRLRVPFVLEYNGSEVWMSRHWGRRLKYETLADRIELLNARSADLVVVVSRAMRDELIARGIDAGRILVNPNGVDTDRYTPALDDAAIRRRYGLAGKTVVGFISTFQPWHGAEVLAAAFTRLIHERPELRDSLRLLMVGDGPGLTLAKRIVSDGGVDDLVVFTGLVEQRDGPEHLAACDILASPHVPNADGSPFFGSPTKLFEYMAMGKAIVASDLDQIGDVLRHGETAWMVPPADAGALTEGMARLIGDPALRAKLGDAARHEVLSRYTWRIHVQRMLDALDARLGANAA
jgi:glycosyltransferase involved in cell wall biosynthesis